jgi:1,2-dihydroxy-3,5-cyclohexadiene-1,4-dicarboxylate dehydrogenase
MLLPRIAIATGDPAGIGPEIALKAVLDPGVRRLCRPLLVGDPDAVELHARCSNLSPDLRVVDRIADADWNDGAVNLLDAHAGNNTPVKLGTIDAAYGRASLASASRAIKAALAGDVEAVVAAPQAERSIAAAGIAFDGYPSFVARETGTPVNDVYLMICFDQSRIVHATLHVSVREAVALITRDRVERVVRVTDAALKKLGIARPKIFVSGLNPHAGEEGMFGREEIDIIEPAIQAGCQTRRPGFRSIRRRHHVPKKGRRCLHRHVARPGPHRGEAAGFQSHRGAFDRLADLVFICGARQRT